MPTYKAPVEDTLFILDDVLHYERYGNLSGFSDASRDIVEAILNEAAKLSEEVLQPINMSGDREGCKRNADGSVTTPKGFKEAFAAYGEGGWLGLTIPSAYGGQGLPHVVQTAVSEYTSAANMAFSMYPGLTSGAMAAILVNGTETAERNATFRKMAEGRVDRHDEPDGAALRHRSRDAQGQGRAAAGRLLFDHRPEDFHLGRRA